MAKPQISAKRLMIDKANTRTVAYVGVAAFIFMFSMVATKALVSQVSYQNKVIHQKRVAVKQLKQDIDSTKQLTSSYDAFVNTPQNIIGGISTGTGQNDGDNSKIVLDSLPSAYDFPGLATSLEGLLQSQNVKIQSITGTDDEIAQSANISSPSPIAVPMPFSLSVQADYTGIQNTIATFEKSIRPIQVQKVSISGNEGNLTLDVTAQTYYQPAKSMKIVQEVVK